MQGYLATVNKFIDQLREEYNDKLVYTNVHTASIVISDEFINKNID